LNIGSVSNATIQFAELQNKYPTMLSLPQAGSSYWGKIDWQLFHKLTSP
jgi:hypothetical protein